MRVATAFVLVLAGLIWSVLFPKKATLDADMVLSVGIGVGLVGTGLVVFYAQRIRRPTSILAVFLLWSLVANAYWLAWARAASSVLLTLSMEAMQEGRAGDVPPQDRPATER